MSAHDHEVRWLSPHDDILQVRQIERLRILTLNRPSARNALSRALQERLTHEYVCAGVDDTVSVVLLTGNGTSFCAGIDLKEVAANADEFRGPQHTAMRSVWEAVVECGKPTIAALNGHAVGGGFELALACDMVVAAEQALGHFPEVQRGMGAMFASVALTRLLPPGIAYRYLYTGDRLAMTEALHWGLVQFVWSADQFLDQALELGLRIARNAPLSLARIKQMSRKGENLPLVSAMRLDVGPNPYLSQDRREGTAAFLEKRAPVWAGQ